MNSTVDEIRKKIDNLDNTVHDLLMERAGLVLQIGEAKRKNNVQVVQPDREIIMLRRLLARHKGPLPQEAVVRIWRELVGAVSLLQTGLKVVVAVPDDSTGLVYWDMAKDYFSSVVPMNKASNALAALSTVREGEATFAVLPWPKDTDENPWWRFLMDENGERAMRVMARLPLGDRSSAGANPAHQALVVARVRFDTSGEDRSFIALDVEHSVSRARIVDKVRELGLEPRSLASTPAKDRVRTSHFLEVEGYVSADDKRLGEILKKLDAADGRIVCIGGYPVPPVYEDKVGKNAVTDQKKSA